MRLPLAGLSLLQCGFIPFLAVSGVILVRLLLIRSLLSCFFFIFASPVFAGQPVDIYRAQALVKSQAEGERKAAARATFGELVVRVSGQRNALDNPVIRAAMPKAQNYLFGFSYKSTNEKLVEGERSFTALSLQLDYEPKAIGQLLRDAQLPLWPAQRPNVLVWLVFKDQRGLHQVPNEGDARSLETASAYRGLPLVFARQDGGGDLAITAEDLWALNHQKILAASASYNSDAVLVVRYTPSSMGPIPPAIVTDPLAPASESNPDAESIVDSIAQNDAPSLPEPAQGPWQGEWLLLHGNEQKTFVDETPIVGGLFNSVIDQVADYFAHQYAIMPTNNGPQQIVLQIGNIKSFAAFKQVQAYLEGLALVERMEVASVNANGIQVRLTTEADTRLLINTLALDRRLELVQPDALSVTEPSTSEGDAVADAMDAEALADLTRALASEQLPEQGVEDVAMVDAPGPVPVNLSAGTVQDPLVYLWQN